MATEKAIRAAYHNMQWHARNLQKAIWYAKEIGALSKCETWADSPDHKLGEVTQSIDELSLAPLAKAAQDSIYNEVINGSRRRKKKKV